MHRHCGMEGSNVRQAHRVWQAGGYDRQCGMEGNKVWQDHKQRVMECTMVWQAQMGMAGSDGKQ